MFSEMYRKCRWILTFTDSICVIPVNTSPPRDTMSSVFTIQDIPRLTREHTSTIQQRIRFRCTVSMLQIWDGTAVHSYKCITQSCHYTIIPWIDENAWALTHLPSRIFPSPFTQKFNINEALEVMAYRCFVSILSRVRQSDWIPEIYILVQNPPLAVL